MKKISPKIALPVVGVLALAVIIVMVLIASKKTEVEILDAPKPLTTTTTIASGEFVLPNGWKTVTGEKIYLAVPKKWSYVIDGKLEEGRSLSEPTVTIEGPSLKEVVEITSNGKGGFKYSNGDWGFVETSGAYDIPEKERIPKEAPLNVEGADSTIIIGESGSKENCSNLKIAFVRFGEVYSIEFPYSCRSDVGDIDVEYITSSESKAAVENVIKSVRFVYVSNSEFEEIG